MKTIQTFVLSLLFVAGSISAYEGTYPLNTEVEDKEGGGVHISQDIETDIHIPFHLDINDPEVVKAFTLIWHESAFKAAVGSDGRVVEINEDTKRALYVIWPSDQKRYRFTGNGFVLAEPQPAYQRP